MATKLDLAPELAGIRLSHPLPEGWQVAECFVDSVTLNGLTVHVVGLLGRSEEGREVTGSAGALGNHPLSRAYYELLERAVVVDAECGPERYYELFDFDVRVDRVTAASVLPQAPREASFVYSRSNGVAAGANWQMACEAARAELVERDRVLRSWYGQTRPLKRRLDPQPSLSALEPYYEFEAYTFPEADAGFCQKSHEVVGVFGFPKTAEAPLICGMAAAGNGALALSKALSECLQRWAFLWGETIPAALPEFACKADYHQELFLWPPMHERLRLWLSGDHVGAARLRPAPEESRTGVRFIALQRSEGPGISVAKATPGGELPLVFGSGHPAVEEPLASWLRVHPIA